MLRLAAPAFAIAALIAAQQARAQVGPESLEGFQLPPGEDAQPAVQGPVAPNTPPPRAAQPAPQAPAPSAVTGNEIGGEHDAPAPPAVAAPQRRAAPTETRSAPLAERAEPPATAAAPLAASATPDAENGKAATEPEAAPPVPETAPARIEPSQTAPDDWWRYALALALLVPMIFAAWLFWRQRPRTRTGSTVIVAPIQRPRPRAPAPPRETPEDTNARLPEDAEVEDGNAQLRFALETSDLSLTLVNATLSYRLTLTNICRRSIHDLTIDGDMVSAHSSLPQEQQLAGPLQELPRLHDVKALLPGQSLILSGKLRLPISAIHPIRRDQAVLFVPLARLRMNGAGMDEVVLETTLIGQRPAGTGAGLRPFRLDLGPRIYTDLGQRPLNAAA